jgi:flagellar motor component MotA
MVISMVLKAIPLTFFLNGPALAVIIFTVIGVIVATSGFKTFVNGYKAVFSSKYPIDEYETAKAIGLFKLLSKATILMSFALVFVGLIGAMANLYDTDFFVFSIAATFIAPVMGIVVSVVFFETPAYILGKSK